MVRGVADALALFLLPFAVYGLAQLLRRRGVGVGPRWSNGRLGLLALAGLGCIVVGLVLLGVVAPRHEGAYVPAHLDNGRLVPGEIGR